MTDQTTSDAFAAIDDALADVSGGTQNGASATNGTGGLRRGPAAELPPPSAPMDVARELVKAKHTYHGGRSLMLRHWRGGWWAWRICRWVEVEQRAMAAGAYAFTADAEYHKVNGDLVPWAPNRHKIADLLDATAALIHLRENVLQPSWLDSTNRGGLLVSCQNGLLDVNDRALLPHSPEFFNSTSVPFAYEPAAPPPHRWLNFLGSLWPDDPAQIDALQEWFGYVISGRLDQHKILLLIGPTRGGKGIIARTLGALVGTENVAGPTLSSLKTDFGLAPLIDKSLAVISDARLDGRGAQVVVERLLSISGEDWLTVNRKYREQWSGKLPCRFMVCSNELPHLGDASGAIAGRFVALQLTESWLGKEDHGLEEALQPELPGILNWALDGVERLARVGRFTRLESTDEAMIALADLASPVSAFLRDLCTLGPEESVPIDAIWAAWGTWAEDNGHAKGTKAMFGRNLRAVVPRLSQSRPGVGDVRPRVYVGVGLQGTAGP